MTTITITRHQLPSGKFRYAVNGKVHTAKSTRRYEFASAYRVVRERSKTEFVTHTITRPTNTASERAFVAEHGPTYETRDAVMVDVPEAEQEVVVFLHARADLAAKGSPDGNRIPGFVRIPGAIEIVEA